MSMIISSFLLFQLLGSSAGPSSVEYGITYDGSIKTNCYWPIVQSPRRLLATPMFRC